MIPVVAQFVTEPDSRYCSNAACKGKYEASARDIRICDFAFERGSSLVANKLVFAILAAVEAKDTFTNPYVAAWLTAAFAGAITQFAVGTFSLVFADSPDGKPSKDAEQCAEWADKSTIEAGYDKVEEDC